MTANNNQAPIVNDDDLEEERVVVIEESVRYLPTLITKHTDATSGTAAVVESKQYVGTDMQIEGFGASHAVAKGDLSVAADRQQPIQREIGEAVAGDAGLRVLGS